MEKEFPKGISIKRPHPNAPEFVKFKMSIKREEAIAWLNSKTDEWINLDGLNSKENKLYLAVDDWKPEAQTAYQKTPSYQEQQPINPEQQAQDAVKIPPLPPEAEANPTEPPF